MSRTAAVILAAGASTRFRTDGTGEPTKLVAKVNGISLVRGVALAALASRARPVLVVTGHASEAVRRALEGLAVEPVFNPGFASGLAGSLVVGLGRVPPDALGALVLLGDMPAISAALIDTLIDAFARQPEVGSVVPARDGRRGNPALLARSLFARAARLQGDEGARLLLRDVETLEVPWSDDSIFVDIDDRAALRAFDAAAGSGQSRPFRKR